MHKVLLVVHAASAVVLIGSTTHLAVLSWRQLRGRTVSAHLLKIYRWVLGVAYLATFGLGAVVYPKYRTDVRPHFDADLPAASMMFEIKEHWVALGGLVLLGVLGRSWSARPGSRVRHLWAFVMVVIVWMAMFTGLSLVTLRSL